MNLEALSLPEDLLLSAQGHVALITLNRPPHNFFDLTWIRELASIFEGLDRDGRLSWVQRVAPFVLVLISLSRAHKRLLAPRQAIPFMTKRCAYSAAKSR
ncbi:MAG: hypothetical protein RL585_395 [Pseudomonadota bacterium]